MGVAVVSSMAGNVAGNEVTVLPGLYTIPQNLRRGKRNKKRTKKIKKIWF